MHYLTQERNGMRRLVVILAFAIMWGGIIAFVLGTWLKFLTTMFMIGWDLIW
jgi:hypothetical protein